MSYNDRRQVHPRARHAQEVPAPKSNRLTVVVAIVLIAALIALGVFATNLIFGSQPSSGESQESRDAALEANDHGLFGGEPTEITISFVGDCTLGTDVRFSSNTFIQKFEEQGEDYSYFFAKVADIFAKDDLTVANLEGVLTSSTAREDKEYAYKGPMDYAQIFVEGNVDAADVANNHSRDYGEQSFTDTEKALADAGIARFGYEDIAYVDVKGVKVALIGTYELRENIGCKEEMQENVAKAKEAGANLIIVYFHWGQMREYVPNSVQVELGRAAIDAGADWVLGAHAHVLQGYEQYKGKYIFYGLGNFCYGGSQNPEDKDTMIVQQTFKVNAEGVQDGEINIIPCRLSGSDSINNFQPVVAEGDEADRILNKLDKISGQLADQYPQPSDSSSN